MSGFNTGEKPFAKHNVIIEFRRKVYQSSCFSNFKKKKKRFAPNESNSIKWNITQKLTDIQQNQTDAATGNRIF